MPARLVERARIVLRAADGWQDKAIAKELRIQPKKVARWRKRFLKDGLKALQKDAPRPGRPRTISESRVKEIVERTTRQTPENATQYAESCPDLRPVQIAPHADGCAAFKSHDADAGPVQHVGRARQLHGIGVGMNLDVFARSGTYKTYRTRF